MTAMGATAVPVRIPRLERQLRYKDTKGYKIGEAPNPGPGKRLRLGHNDEEKAGRMLISTQNCTALDANLKAVSGTDGHIKASARNEDWEGAVRRPGTADEAQQA